MSTIAPDIAPVQDWESFLDEMEWRQGEHVTIAAPTGWGKTTLGLDLLRNRSNGSANYHSTILGTKPADDTLEEFAEAEGYRIFRKWPIPDVYRKTVIWPKTKNAKDIVAHRDFFRPVLQDIFAQGRRAVFVDELDYFCNYLKLSPLVELYWRQGRSVKLSLLGGTQRPAFIPLLAYDQSTHLFVGRDNDDTNQKRYASFLGTGRPMQRLVRERIGSLTDHSFLYMNSREGGMLETKVTL